MKAKKPVCILLAATLILSVAIVSVCAEPAPKLLVDPATYTGTLLGEVFKIDVNITDAHDLKHFEFRLGYNTTLLDAVDAVMGPLTIGALPLSYQIEMNETEGYVWFNVTCMWTAEGNGTLASITFEVTYAESASCVLDLYETELLDSDGETLLHEVDDGNYLFAILGVTVTTDKPTYFPGENVEIHGNLTLNAQPHQGLVALEVDNPRNDTKVRRTLQIGPTPPPGNITIIDVIPCDAWGNPKESFMIGTLAYFSVTVENSGTEGEDVVITINAYDGNMVPLRAPTNIGSIAPGVWPNYVIRSVAIPDWAYIGTGIVYASVFTDYPRDGGVPLCPEKSANFTITGGGRGAAALQTQNSGNYTLTFKLAPNARPGVYQVYASACYGKQSVIDSTVFFVPLQGDVNGDGTVSVADMVLIQIHFGESCAEFPQGDVNGDCSVTIADMVIVQNNLGKTL